MILGDTGKGNQKAHAGRRPALTLAIGLFGLTGAVGLPARRAIADGADHGALALKAYNHADYETALREYAEAAKGKGGATPEMLIRIARSLDRLFRSEDAVVAYIRFVHGSPSRPETDEARGRISFLKHHLAENAPPEKLAQQNIERGTALYKLELYAEARSEFEGAVRVLPDKPNGYRWLGLTQERLGNCAQALKSFDSFLEIVARDDQRISEVTEVQRRCEAKLAAEKLAAAPPPAATPARPAHVEAPRVPDREELVKQHVDRGIELYGAGKYKEAREEFAMARTLAPEKATPFRWLGIVDARLDRCADAVKNLEVFLDKVKAADPRALEARELLDSCREKLSPAPRPADVEPVRNTPAPSPPAPHARAADAPPPPRRIASSSSIPAPRPYGEPRRAPTASAAPEAESAAAESADHAPLTRDSDPRRSPASLILPVSVGVGALVLAGAGAGLLGAGATDIAYFRSTCAIPTMPPTTGHCPPAAVAATETELNAGYVLLGIGAAAAVADGVLWYLWLRNANRPAPHALVVPTLNGLLAVGRF